MIPVDDISEIYGKSEDTKKEAVSSILLGGKTFLSVVLNEAEEKDPNPTVIVNLQGDSYHAIDMLSTVVVISTLNLGYEWFSLLMRNIQEQFKDYFEKQGSNHD